MGKAKPVPLDHLRGKKKPVVRSTEIFVDSEVADEIAELRAQLDEVERDMDTAARRDGGRVAITDYSRRREELRERIDAAHEAARESGALVSFSFRSLGRKVYQKLIDEHPPTDEQQKEADKRAKELELPQRLARLRWNADTFPPALVAAASHEPKISPDEAWELFHVSEDWNEAEVADLLATAQAAQETRSVADLGKSRRG
jgi:hypothetical protein